MKIKVLFFANFKELLNCASLECELNENETITDLCQLLEQKGQVWSKVFQSPSNSVKVAVNQEMAEFCTQLAENDEVAFFPPVTGG